MPQYIRDGKSILDRLREDRRTAATYRRAARWRISQARGAARWDGKQVEIHLDHAVEIFDKLDKLEDAIEDLIANELAPKLQRRTKGEDVEASDLAQRVAEIEEKLAWIDRAMRSPHFAIEQPERRNSP